MIDDDSIFIEKNFQCHVKSATIKTVAGAVTRLQGTAAHTLRRVLNVSGLWDTLQ